MGKKENLAIPLIGSVIEALDFLLVGRDKKDSKDVRDKMIEEIAERTRQAEKGLVPPIGIFPEGATTNGESLL